MPNLFEFQANSKNCENITFRSNFNFTHNYLGWEKFVKEWFLYTLELLYNLSSISWMGKWIEVIFHHLKMMFKNPYRTATQCKLQKLQNIKCLFYVLHKCVCLRNIINTSISTNKKLIWISTRMPDMPF